MPTWLKELKPPRTTTWQGKGIVRNQKERFDMCYSCRDKINGITINKCFLCACSYESWKRVNAKDHQLDNVNEGSNRLWESLRRRHWQSIKLNTIKVGIKIRSSESLGSAGEIDIMGQRKEWGENSFLQRGQFLGFAVGADFPRLDVAFFRHDSYFFGSAMTLPTSAACFSGSAATFPF